MKCYFVLREDLKYSSDKLFRLAVQNTAKMSLKIDSNEWNSNPELDIFMMFTLNYIYQLEDKLLNDGIRFMWIEENEVLIGLLIEPTTKDIKKEYLNDCLSLEHYAEHRKFEFNELTLPNKPKECFSQNDKLSCF